MVTIQGRQFKDSRYFTHSTPFAKTPSAEAEIGRFQIDLSGHHRVGALIRRSDEKGEKQFFLQPRSNPTPDRSRIKTTPKTNLLQEGVFRMKSSKKKQKLQTDMDPESAAVQDSGNNQNQQPALPENMTEEPQHSEHMHLSLIRNNPSLISVYQVVSDDEGQLINDTGLENEIREFIEAYKDKRPDEIENIDDVLEQLRSLYQRYELRVNRAESISEGTLTKYRIRLGTLFEIEKKLLKATGKEWVEYFAEKYGQKKLRSAQDYMALARIPNIIRYAVFGKERLIEIKRAIKELEISDDDPVAAFLRRSSINYNPDEAPSDEGLAELKLDIDVSIFLTKLKSVEEDKGIEFNVNEDLLKSAIAGGKKPSNGIIENMTIILKSGGDVNRYLDQVVINGGQENTLVRATHGVQSLPKLVIGLGNLVEHMKIHPQVLTEVKLDTVEALERHTSELKRMLEERQ
jgi:hypothetical protein